MAEQSTTHLCHLTYAKQTPPPAAPLFPHLGSFEAPCAASFRHMGSKSSQHGNSCLTRSFTETSSITLRLRTTFVELCLEDTSITLDDCRPVM